MTCHISLPEKIQKLLLSTGTAVPEKVIPDPSCNEDLSQEIMGKKMSLTDWHDFMGLPEKASVDVRYVAPDRIMLFSYDCPFLRSQDEPFEIVVKKDSETQQVTATISALYLQENAPSGLGTAMVSKMIAEIHQKYPSIKKIKLFAAKAPRYGKIAPVVGYYFWGRVGFDGKLAPTFLYDRKNFPSLLEQSPYKDKTLLSEIMATESGRDWWRENGIGLDLEFDLSSSSQLARWQKYLQDNL